MIQRRSLYALAASAGVALAMLTAAGTAQAGGGVSWSVGIGAPGVAVGVASPQPYYYAPPPAYYGGGYRGGYGHRHHHRGRDWR